MQTCGHCGKVNDGAAAVCSECGLELSDSRLQRFATRMREQSNTFFNYRVASIALFIEASVYASIALLNLWKGRGFSLRGEQYWATYAYWGAFWNVTIAVLCYAGRQMMSSKIPTRLLTGAIVTAVALSVVMRIWIGGLLSGLNPVPGVEALLTWPPLIYAIIYAYRESKQPPKD